MNSLFFLKRSADFPDVLTLGDVQNLLADSIEDREIDYDDWDYTKNEELLLAELEEKSGNIEIILRIFSNNHPDCDSNKGYYVKEMYRFPSYAVIINSLTVIAVCLLFLTDVISLPGEQNPVAVISLNLTFWMEALILFPLMVSIIAFMPRSPSVIEENASHISNLTTTGNPAYTNYLIIIIMTVGAGILTVLNPLFRSLAITFLFLTILSSILLAVKPSYLEKSWFEPPTLNLSIPAVVSGYYLSLMMLAPGIILCYAILWLSPLSVQQLLLTSGLMAVIVTYTWYSYYKMRTKSFAVTLNNFLESRNPPIEELEPINKREQVILLFSLTILAYFAVFSIIYYMFNSPHSDLTIIHYGPLLLILFFILGFIYQSMNLIGTYITLLQSRPTKIKTDLNVGAEMRVSEGIKSSVAITTGVSNYILVSEEVIEKFDQDTLSALLAHEEAHLKNKDTHLSTALQVFSPFLFVGVNVLLVLLNFTQREIRADREAAEKAGKENLIQALEQSNELSDDSFSVVSQPSFSPTRFQSDNENKSQDLGKVYSVQVGETKLVLSTGDIHRWFGEFFGSFGVTKAHPSIEKRIQLIDSQNTYD